MIIRSKFQLRILGPAFRTISVGLVGLLSLSACDGLRLHDQGRLQTATEAKTLAEEFSAEGVVVFEPLEKRQDAISVLSEKVIDLAVQHELETFRAVLPELTAADVSFQLLDTMYDWHNDLQAFDDAEMRAVQAVNDALRRRDNIKLVLTTSIAEEKRKMGPLEAERAKLQPRLNELKTKLESQGETCKGDFDCDDLAERVGMLEQGIAHHQERIERMQNLLPGSEPDDTASLQVTLETLKNRLKWMDKRVGVFLKAFDKASGLVKDNDLSADAEEVLGGIGDNVEQAEAHIKPLFDATKTALDEIDSDEHVVAARALLAVTIKDQVDLEQARIGEYRRYLGAVRRLRETFDTREIVAVCEIFFPAFYRVWPGSRPDDPLDDELLDLYNEFAWNFRYKGQAKIGADVGEYGCDRPPIVARPQAGGELEKYAAVDSSKIDSQEAWIETKKAMDDAKTGDTDPCAVSVPLSNNTIESPCKELVRSSDADDWDHGRATLAEYLAANVQREAENAQGAYTVAALGILSFVERPFLDNAVNLLYEERNRHALRLSKINTQQRAALLTELAAAIEIYEQGGLKPEEIAELVLFASQVGALFFIGFQQ